MSSIVQSLSYRMYTDKEERVDFAFITLRWYGRLGRLRLPFFYRTC